MTEKLPVDLLRMHKGISFVGVTTCFFCHDGNGNIFMAQRSKNARDEHGKWDIGGGGLKWGLSAEENVKKEVLEEYGTKPQGIEFLGYRDAFRELDDGTATHWLALDFLVRVERSKVFIAEPDMFDDSGWFNLDELPLPIHSQLPAAFKKYDSKFRTLIS